MPDNRLEDHLQTKVPFPGKTSNVDSRGLPDNIRDKIIRNAYGWKGVPHVDGGDSRKGIDCSHFVHRIYVEAGINYPYTTTKGNWKVAGFVEVTTPLKGDLILWKGHVGIVNDPLGKTFIGSQTTKGVSIASYNSGYWGSGYKFLRYSK